MPTITTFRKFNQQRDYRYEAAKLDNDPGFQKFLAQTADMIERGRNMRFTRIAYRSTQRS